MTNFCSNYVVELQNFLKSCQSSFKGEEISVDQAMEIWADETHRIYKNDNCIFFIGNGASATMAEHFGFDAMQNGKLKTFNFAETSYLTAISNDLSYEELFLLKLNRFGKTGDMLVSISSSGNSPNIVNAITYAKDKGLFTITLSAMKADNHSISHGDLTFYVPAQTYGLAESAHSAILHCWLDTYLDKFRGGRH